MNNGRVNINNQFELFDKIVPNVKPTSYSNATLGVFNPTTLSNKFFSSENIMVIQRAITDNVKQMTDYTIPPQNEDIIKNMMWNVYMEFCAHMPDKIEQQIKSLNQKVLEHCIPGIIESIKADIKYRYDISHMHVPMEHSVSTTNKGLRNNEFKHFF